MSHAQVSAKWHETNHTDPIDYLASHGKTWANLVADVTVQYNQMEEEDKVLNASVLLYTKDDHKFMAGKSDLKIAKGLEHDKILTGAGKATWLASTVKSILKNEKWVRLCFKRLIPSIS